MLVQPNTVASKQGQPALVMLIRHSLRCTMNCWCTYSCDIQTQLFEFAQIASPGLGGVVGHKHKLFTLQCATM